MKPTTAGLFTPPLEPPGNMRPVEVQPRVIDHDEAKLWTFCYDNQPEAGFCISVDAAREIARRRIVRESLARDRITNLVEGSKKSDVRAEALGNEARLLRVLLILVPIVAVGAGIGVGVGIGQALTH